MLLFFFVAADVDGLWVVYRFGGGGGAVGQLGFALLVTGAVRNKSAASVMLLHVVAPCVVGLCYFLFGFAMAFGSTPDANNRTVGAQASAVRGGGGEGGRGGEVEGVAETGYFFEVLQPQSCFVSAVFLLTGACGCVLHSSGSVF